MTSLEELYLRDAEVDDAGLTQLKGLTRLRLLDLNGTRVTVAGVYAAPEGNPPSRDRLLTAGRLWNQLRIAFTTRPWTSVRRKSRPWNL